MLVWVKLVLALKQLDKALDCYKLAARYSGGDLSYLRKVADLQERMGLLMEAGRTYMAAGELLLRQKQYEEAIDMWQLAVRLEPGLVGRASAAGDDFSTAESHQGCGA